MRVRWDVVFGVGMALVAGLAEASEPAAPVPVLKPLADAATEQAERVAGDVRQALAMCLRGNTADYGEMRSTLSSDKGERLRAVAPLADFARAELWISSQTGEYAIIARADDGRACAAVMGVLPQIPAEEA